MTNEIDNPNVKVKRIIAKLEKTLKNVNDDKVNGSICDTKSVIQSQNKLIYLHMQM